MTQKTNFMHPAAKMYAQEAKDGKLDRREFLSRATALGVTTAAAYGLLGLETPAQAGGHAKKRRHHPHANGCESIQRSAHP